MARLAFAEEFVAGVTRIESKRVRDRVIAFVASLEQMPQLGSPDVRPTIKARFGGEIRKLAVSPFDIFYRHRAHEDEAEVLAILHQRQVR